MSEYLACKICIATKGLRGKDLSSMPKNEEELVEHIERVHHMPVKRKGETVRQATKRFLQQYPEAKTCPDCIEVGALWTRGEYE